MKRFPGIWQTMVACLFLNAATVFAASSAQLKSIDALIEQRKYHDAFSKIVATVGAGEADPDLLARKVVLSIRYSARIIGNMDAYGFTNLEPGETILDLRRKPPVRSYQMHSWAASEVLPVALKKHARHAGLHAAAAEYYVWVCGTGAERGDLSAKQACERATELLKMTRGRFPRTAELCHQGVVMALFQNKLEAADRHSADCFARFSTHVRTNTARGLLASRLGRREEAERMFLRASIMETDPVNKSNQRGFLAFLKHNDRDYVAAAYHFEKAFRYQPNKFGYLGFQIDSLLRAGRTAEARRVVTRFSRREPLPIMGVNMVQGAYGRTKNLPLFFPLCDSLIATMGERPRSMLAVLMIRGMAFLQAGQVERARADIVRAEQILAEHELPDEAEWRRHIADGHAELKKHSRAKSNPPRALEPLRALKPGGGTKTQSP